MNAERLLAHFETISEAPDAVARLRRFILDLAVRGKLVEQDPEDEPAEELLKKAAADISNYQTQFNIRSYKTLERSEPASPFPLPQGWQWTQPLRIFRSITDGDHQAPPRSPDGIPFLVIGDVRDRSINYEADRFVPESYYDTLSIERRPAKGDLLYTLVGSYGIPVIVREDTPFCVQRHIGILRPSRFASVEFLALLMGSMLVYEQASNIATGIAQKTVPLGGLRKLRIPLPPLAEQHRIVAKVEELMALCDQLEASRQQREQHRERLVAATLQRLNQPAEDPETSRNDARFALQVLPSLTTTPAQIKQLRQTILNLAVRGKLVQQDPEDEPAAELLKRIAAERTEKKKHAKGSASSASNAHSHFTEAPLAPSWCWARLGQIALSMRYGTSTKCEYLGAGVPVLRIPNASKGVLCLDDIKLGKLSEEESRELALVAGDILMIRSNGSLDNVGRSAVVTPEAEGMSFAGYLVRLRLSLANVNPDFVWITLNSTTVRNQVEIPIRSTVGLKNINLTEFGGLAFPLPPLAEQHRIVAKVDELMALCDQLEQQLSQADQQRRRLLEAVLAEALGEPDKALASLGSA